MHSSVFLKLEVYSLQYVCAAALESYFPSLVCNCSFAPRSRYTESGILCAHLTKIKLMLDEKFEICFSLYNSLKYMFCQHSQDSFIARLQNERYPFIAGWEGLPQPQLSVALHQTSLAINESWLYNLMIFIAWYRG